MSNSSAMSFSEQIDLVDSIFSSWNDCEKVVALYYLLRKLPPVQTKFLAQVLDQFVSGFSPNEDHEEQANNPVFLNSLFTEASTENQLIPVLLHCLPLLRAGNTAAKSAYLRLIPAAVLRATETGRYRTECQQVLSYALIHPAITADELAVLNNLSSHPFQTSSTSAAPICGQNGSDENNCVCNDLLLTSLDKKPLQAIGNGSNTMFSNGVIGYGLQSVSSATSPHQLHMHQHTSTSSRPLTSSLSLTTLSKPWMLGPTESSGSGGATASDSSLQYPVSSSVVRRTRTGTPDLGSASSDCSPSSYAAVTPSTTPSGHVPLHPSKSAGFANTQFKHGGSSHHQGHPKLTRASAIAHSLSHVVGDVPHSTSVTDWLRHNVDAIGTGRYDSGRFPADLSSCRLSSSLEGASLGVELLSSSSPAVHMPLSPQSSDASSGSGGRGEGGAAGGVAGDPYGLHGGLGVDSDDGTSPGMQGLFKDSSSTDGKSGNTVTSFAASSINILVWLKILRLHKYKALFAQMSYDEMMNLSDEWLDTQGVTKGARNKILISVKKLHERPATLRQIEKDLMSSGNVRTAVDQLYNVVNTPIKAWDASNESVGSTTVTGSDTSKPVSTECAPETSGSSVEGERRSSESESLSDRDLPGLITRVLGKLCTQLLVTTRPDSECLTKYLHLLDRCIAHQAYTDEQNRKMSSWKQQIQRFHQVMQRQHRTAASSASLPPQSITRPVGAHRQLRGQPSVGATSQSQPAWTFISSASSSRSSGVNRQPLASWQASAQHYQTPSSSNNAAPQTNVFCPPRLAHLDAPASYVKLPLSRTQSAPLRSAKPNISVMNPPVMENDASSASEDLHASLNSLCISMMEAAMGSSLGDGNWYELWLIVL